MKAKIIVFPTVIVVMALIFVKFRSSIHPKETKTEISKTRQGHDMKTTIADEMKIRYIGGSTALFEIGGLHFLTDPTFDRSNSEYDVGVAILRKLIDPSKTIEEIGKIDFVLLSHDHHPDNLDKTGRQFLPMVDKVYTTTAGSERLKGNAIGMENWEKIGIPTKDNRILMITATPGQHGPADGDRGPVMGFVLHFKDTPQDAVYITGDTVWFDGIEEVSKRFNIKMVILFMGAATLKKVGPEHLTMTAEEGIIVAKHFDNAKIVPLHFEGWDHYTESAVEIKNKFRTEGLSHRLQWARKL